VSEYETRDDLNTARKAESSEIMTWWLNILIVGAALWIWLTLLVTVFAIAYFAGELHQYTQRG